MRSTQILAAFLFTLTGTIQAEAKLEAHEWGTFTSLVGSNGKTQNGMYHEDEALPDFVHGFGELALFELPPPPPAPEPEPFPRPPKDHCVRPSKVCFSQEFMDRNVITQKMETPVIYFYSDSVSPVKVSVNVKFPEGIITETYPGPVKTFPSTANIQTIAGGDTTFEVDVLPTRDGVVPTVPAGNIYGHARRPYSNLVRTGIETEKFIFYRGVGRFQPRFAVRSKGGNLILKANMVDKPQAAFLVDVDSKGDAQMIELGAFISKGFENVPATMIADLKTHPEFAKDISPNVHRGAAIDIMLTDALTDSGLSFDESFAMLNTWKNGYLKVPGLRLLYILPRNEVDQVLPLTMTPAPDELVRSFIGRIEILLDTEENEIIDRIITQDFFFKPASLGRFAEPILRRVSEVYNQRPDKDPHTTGLILNLIKQVSSVDDNSGTVH